MRLDDGSARRDARHVRVRDSGIASRRRLRRPRLPAMVLSIPTDLPLDTDNDLLIINAGLTPAVGEITHLTGRLLAENGEPVRNAFIEIWQADTNGSYIHTGGRNDGKIDRQFSRLWPLSDRRRRAVITSERSSRCRTRCSASFERRTFISR